MTKQVEKGIFELLKNLASGKVYLDMAPDGAGSDGPFIVIFRTGSERWRSINGPSGMAVAYLQIDAYAKLPYDAKNLGAAIETILDGYRNTVSYGTDSPQESVRIASSVLTGDEVAIDQEEEPVLYRNSLSFNVTYQQ